MASVNDRLGVGESAQGSQPVAFSIDVKSAARSVAPPTQSLVSRLMTKLRTWRRRRQERAELAQMSQAELHDIGVSSSELWTEIHKPFWK